ncbi:MAG: DNA-binding protein [Arcobacteraceae bacterium]|jgi:hypothetical protein|nr:DNA-binding protein [Arcobacteraceae bacterium]
MKTITDFNALLPHGVLFSIKEISSMGLIKSDLLKKLIYSQKIEVTKLASKNFVSRTALISYLEANTIAVQ